MSGLKRIAACFVARRTNIVKLAGGFTIYNIFERFFDYILCGWLILQFGPIKGGIAIVVISITVDLLTLKFYDWSKEDWLGLEMLKSIKEYNGKYLIGRAIGWILTQSVLVQILFLPFIINPFRVVVYMRHGAYTYNGLIKRDWAIFLYSTFIGSIYWVGVIYGGIEIFKFLFL